MSRQIIMTGDGSHTISAGDQVTYHSRFGALQESKHVFIGAGLMPVLTGAEGSIRVFEMGFGTGLNALLTLMGSSGREIYYETVDEAPLAMDTVKQLNYCLVLGRPDLQPVYERIHAASWGEEVEIVPGFVLLKVKGNGVGYRPLGEADLVYFDAFDPGVQPELWGEEVFREVYRGMRIGGVLVTYCCKGAVRRAMLAVGFTVEKLPGPPGKREILRARKP